MPNLLEINILDDIEHILTDIIMKQQGEPSLSQIKVPNRSLRDYFVGVPFIIMFMRSRQG